MKRGQETFRSFIAIKLPEHIRQNLWETGNLLDVPDAKVKWVSPDRMHLTLRFLGDITQPVCDSLCAQLASIPESLLVSDASLEQIGAFPSIRKPKVFWAGIKLSDQVFEMQKRVEEMVSRAGIKLETKPFKPHITLGRVKTCDKNSMLLPRLRMISINPQPFYLTSLVLFKSELTRQGPIYTPLFTRPFAESH